MHTPCAVAEPPKIKALSIAVAARRSVPTTLQYPVGRERLQVFLRRRASRAVLPELVLLVAAYGLWLGWVGEFSNQMQGFDETIHGRGF